MSSRGGDRSAKAVAAGKKMGRPKKEPLPVPKVRRDVAYEVLEILNLPEKQRDEARKKCPGEVAIHLEFILDGADKRLRWDVLRYDKECVDGKPLVRQEDKVIFDPNAPLRVTIEHIGRPKDQAATQAK